MADFVRFYRTRKYHLMHLEHRLTYEAQTVQTLGEQLRTDSPRLPESLQDVLRRTFDATHAEMSRAMEILGHLNVRAHDDSALGRIRQVLFSVRFARTMSELSSLLDDVHASANDILTQLSALPRLAPRPAMLMEQASYIADRLASKDRRFDVFISHAGEDKNSFAIPLHRALAERGITAFVDEKELAVGEDAPNTMEEAMATATIGVFILSAEFAAKKWPMLELMCFQRRCEKTGKPQPGLLPVFYRLSMEECTDENIFDAKYPSGENVFSEHGFFKRIENGEVTMREVKESLRMLSKSAGVRNNIAASNEGNSSEMVQKRSELVQVVAQEVSTGLNRIRKRAEGAGPSANIEMDAS